MRQYRILYQRPGSKFSTLEPHVHTTLYDKPEIHTGVGLMHAHPYVEGLAIRLDTELFNIVSFEQEARAANAFVFEDKLVPNEPVDNKALLQRAMEQS